MVFAQGGRNEREERKGRDMREKVGPIMSHGRHISI